MVTWGEGESFLFDDTSETRVILLVQVRRPMAWPGSIAPDLFLWGICRSPFVKEAIRKIENWDETYKAIEAAEG